MGVRPEPAERAESPVELIGARLAEKAKVGEVEADDRFSRRLVPPLGLQGVTVLLQQNRFSLAISGDWTA